MCVEIKELLPKDLTQDLLDILENAFKHQKISIWKAKQRLKRRRSANIHTFVLFLDGKLIGTGSALIELKLFKEIMPYIMHIEDVAIHKEYRGFGYGKQLINYMIEFAKTKECYKIVLFCSNDNIKFYKKCGFKHACNLMRRDLD